MKQLPTPATQTEWKEFAGNFLKANLKLAGMEYSHLQTKLAEIGVQQSINAIGHKLNKGSFSAVFMMQVLIAMDINKIDLPLRKYEQPA